jgi:hypothetical protein
VTYLRYTVDMMKKIILNIFLLSTLLFAGEQQEHKHLPYDISARLLKSIQNDAIILGKGEKQVYVFVDPLCPHSRKFITMVSKNPKMLSKYRYYVYLYSIPRLKSTDVVSAVYLSSKPVETLLRIMVEHKVSSTRGNDATLARVSRIAEVAQTMDVYKRPYLFISK